MEENRSDKRSPPKKKATSKSGKTAGEARGQRDLGDESLDSDDEVFRKWNEFCHFYKMMMKKHYEIDED